MSNFTKRLGALAAMVALSAVAACGSGGSNSSSDDQIAAIKEAGTLRIGVASFKPDNFRGPDGEWTGSMVDLATDLANEWEVKPEFVSTTFENIVAGLQADQFDLALDLTKTDERAKVITFTDPIYVSVDNLVVARDKFQTWDEASAKGRSICVAKGGANEVGLRSTTPEATIVALPDSDSCYLQLTSGRVDGVWNQWLNTSEYVRANPQYGVLYPPTAANFASTNLGVSKKWSSSSVDALNADIKKLMDAKGGWSGYTEPYHEGKPTDGAIGNLPDYAVDATK
ncbi:ABC transporter substrate-binding protein [Mycolicibacterium sp. YH-1]|uniref:substrate-binding periplasmic protein n=1 Tax=Mycolicibacterium sp. YH-1 TaxID=2908837 RepID=UPI001F4C3EB3|nr:transporter substrate-binding domain-containing protein [Mycolicibacterium sp. YH-1]UNB52887.1 transporter substrate-binding domain-containing protein [Mycolicibacterium sp. YH-1]